MNKEVSCEGCPANRSVLLEIAATYQPFDDWYSASAHPHPIEEQWGFSLSALSAYRFQGHFWRLVRPELSRIDEQVAAGLAINRRSLGSLQTIVAGRRDWLEMVGRTSHPNGFAKAAQFLSHVAAVRTFTHMIDFNNLYDGGGALTEIDSHELEIVKDDAVARARELHAIDQWPTTIARRVLGLCEGQPAVGTTLRAPMTSCPVVDAQPKRRRRAAS